MNDLRDTSRVFADLGTFWSRMLAEGEGDQARRVVHTVVRHALASRLSESLRRLITPGWIEFEHLDLRFDRRQIALRHQLQSLRTEPLADDEAIASQNALAAALRALVGFDPPTVGDPFGDGSGLVFVDEKGDVIVNPDTSIDASAIASITPPSWLLPIDPDLRPLSLQSTQGTLILGQDFILSGTSLEFFREPTALFPDDILHITRGLRRRTSLFSYPLRMNQLVRPVPEISGYYRHNQSVTQLARAAATAAGYLVLPRESTVVEVHPAPNSTSYVFDDASVMTVDYNHTPLVEGTTYPEGTIIGNPFSLFGPETSRPGWYRDPAINWTAGLPLRYLGPWANLAVPDGNVTATREAAATAPGKWHCRFPLAGPSEDADRFWARVWDSERITGHYLADIIGIDDTTASVVVNPLDVFFQAFLHEKALLVVFPTLQSGAARATILEFLQREKPTTSLLIVCG